MNSELTNVFEIIKKNLSEEFDSLNLNNKEFASFLHYNVHNKALINKDELNKCLNFRSIDMVTMSSIFAKDSKIYSFPVGNHGIEFGNEMNAFCVSDTITSISINNNGLFIEKNNMKNRIVSKYYDNAALSEMAKDHLSIENIEELEDYIKRMGIEEDRLIVARRDGGNIIINVMENNEAIKSDIFSNTEKRTLYSVFYEYMKNEQYYVGFKTKWTSKLSK